MFGLFLIHWLLDFIVIERVPLDCEKLLQNRIIGKGFLQAIAFNVLGNAFLFSSESLTDNLEELILSNLSVRNV